MNLEIKRSGFLSLDKNIGKNLRNKYSQKLLDSAKNSGTTKVARDAIKSASKIAIQKTAEATGDLIGNKITDKILKVEKTLQNNLEAVKGKEDISKERHTSPEKR